MLSQASEIWIAGLDTCDLDSISREAWMYLDKMIHVMHQIRLFLRPWSGSYGSMNWWSNWTMGMLILQIASLAWTCEDSRTETTTYEGSCDMTVIGYCRADFSALVSIFLIFTGILLTAVWILCFINCAHTDNLMRLSTASIMGLVGHKPWLARTYWKKSIMT